MQRKVYVLGGSTSKFIGKNHPDFIWKKHKDFGTKQNPSLKEYIVDTVRETLRVTGADASHIQKAYVSNFAGELFSSQGHLGSGVAEASEKLMFVPSLRVEGACASGALAFSSAVDSIRAGLDVALVVGGEAQNTVTARQGGDYLARAADYERQRPLDDFTFPALFATRKKHYLKRYGTPQKDIDQVVYKAYLAGNNNPLAHMRTMKMSLKDIEESAFFLGNEELKEYLKLAECSQVSDGGAGLLVVSEEGLKKLGKSKSDAIELLSTQIATGNLFKDTEETFTDLLTTRAAAQRAYAEAKIDPREVGVAEVHDCFTIAEIGMNEALGFSKPGEGAYLHTDRNIVNTGGGLVSFGHPVGATGVKQINEVYRQMKGQIDGYQLPGTIDIGLAANMGGNDKTSVVSIFRNA
jgi:acetyl-CoA acyltransferase